MDDSTTIISPTRFQTLAEAAELAAELETTLANLGLGDASVHPAICSTYAAILANAAEHGKPPDVAHTVVKYHHIPHMYRFTVSDSGPGIAASLADNPALTVPTLERDALLLAVTEPISASQEPGRGQGLCQALQTARLPGNTMMVHSRGAILNLMAHGEPLFNTVPAHPGTIVYMTFQA